MPEWRTLTQELDELERTDPRVREAAERLRATTEDIGSGAFAERMARIERFRTEVDRIFDDHRAAERQP